MAALQDTTVLRKGSSQSVDKLRTVSGEVLLNTRYRGVKEMDLRLSLTTSASGTGWTDYRILIGVDDYPAIIKAMCDVDENSALSAMAHEMAGRLKARTVL